VTSHFDRPGSVGRASVAYLLPDPGIPVGGTKGASVHVDALCSAMARQGVAVTLYAAKVTGPLTARGSHTVSVVPVDVGRVTSGRGGDASRVKAAHQFFEFVGAALDSDRPDWIHERLSLFAGSGTSVAAERALTRIVEVNAPIADERSRHFSLDLVSEAKLAERRALRGARVISVSGRLAAWARQAGASEACVIPNGADTTALACEYWSPWRSRIRADLGFDDDQVVIGFTGSLKPWHGVENLITAVAEASRAANVGLLVVGDGPQREVIEQLVGSLPVGVHAALTGAVPAREVPKYLSAMDVAAAPYLPSDEFYFSPLKVAEAMAFGLPVIASDFSPVRDLLGTTGILVVPGDVDDLGGAIEDLAGDPQRRASLAHAARALAIAKLDWREVATRSIEFALGSNEPVMANR